MRTIKKSHIPFRATEKIRGYILEALKALEPECRGVYSEQVQQFILVKHGRSYSNHELGNNLTVLVNRGVVRKEMGRDRQRIWFLIPDAPLGGTYDKVWICLSADLSDQLTAISKAIKIPKSYLLERALAYGLKDYLSDLMKEHGLK
jgi:hypothetical protein